jgi:hypothetical protein
MPNDSSAGQLAATWQGLAQLPRLLDDVKAAVLTLRTLITTPAAAVATGSPPASGAIVVLGAELAMFLAQTVQAIDDDIEALRAVERNYHETERELTAAATAGTAALGGVAAARRPALNGGTQSCRARTALHATSQIDDVVVPIAAAVHASAETGRRLLLAGELAVRGLGDAVGGTLDDVPLVGRSAAAAVRAATSSGGDVIASARQGVEHVDGLWRRAAEGAVHVSGRADRLLTLDASCTTGDER